MGRKRGIVREGEKRGGQGMTMETIATTTTTAAATTLVFHQRKSINERVCVCVCVRALGLSDTDRHCYYYCAFVNAICDSRFYEEPSLSLSLSLCTPRCACVSQRSTTTYLVAQLT